MKFPIIIISYGAFGFDQKKLFIVEEDGVMFLPVFNDPIVAAQFQSSMQKRLSGVGDDRRLMTQLCEKPNFAKDMLTVIASVAPELTSVIFDPSPPEGLNEDAKKAGVQALNKIVPIEDVIQELDELLEDSKSGSDGISE